MGQNISAVVAGADRGDMTPAKNPRPLFDIQLHQLKPHRQRPVALDAGDKTTLVSGRWLAPKARGVASDVLRPETRGYSSVG